MEKLVRDFGILLVIGFGGLLMKDMLTFDNSIAVVGSAAFLSLISEIVRCLIELDIERGLLNKNVVLIVRDSAIAFIVSYAFVTAAFGVMTFAHAIPYAVAALAPTVVVTAISKELRIPGTNKLIVGKTQATKEKMAA